MLLVMAASARKYFWATRRTAVQNMLNSSGGSTHRCLRPCPTSNYCEHFPILQPHSCCMKSWNWRMMASIPGGTPKRARTSHRRVHSTKSYALVRSTKHKKKGVSFLRQFLQSSYYEHHVNCRALGSEPTLFLRKNVLAFAIVTRTTRDDIEENFAGVNHQGYATIIATLSPILLLVKHRNRCIFLLLRHATSPPHSDDDIVELSERLQVSFVSQNFQDLGRKTIGSCRFSVSQRTDRLLYFVPRRDVVQRSARAPLIKLVHNARVIGRRIGGKQLVKPPHPPLADEGAIPQQSTFLVFGILGVKRLFPYTSIPLRGL